MWSYGRNAGGLMVCEVDAPMLLWFIKLSEDVFRVLFRVEE